MDLLKRRRRPDRSQELRERHREGLRRVQEPHAAPRHAEPAPGLPVGDPLPALAPAGLTPAVLRAAILRDGCLLVRGLIPRGRATALADGIERAFAARAGERAGRPPQPEWYLPFVPERGGDDLPDMRPWIEEGGGVLACDSPRLAHETLALLEQAGVPQLVEGYLGEPATISTHKTTLRKAEPTVAGAWHQDGAFMGEVRALNLWLSLSDCGVDAPGLDLVPRRLEHLVTAGTDDAMIDFQVSRRMAEEAAAPHPIVRPAFAPGDALLFDDRFLHATGSDPSMRHPRYAVECWFFGASAFPDGYAPLAV